MSHTAVVEPAHEPPGEPLSGETPHSIAREFVRIDPLPDFDVYSGIRVCTAQTIGRLAEGE